MTEASAPVFVKWLAFSQDGDIPLCLSREEARTGAAKLRRFISEGVVSPEDVEVTEESKDVLWALTELISESSDAEPRARLLEADRIYRFVRGLNWAADLFDEQQDILRRIATAGWAAVGLTIKDVNARRFGSVTRAVEAKRVADLYVDSDPADCSAETKRHYISDIDWLLAICDRLKEERDRTPARVAVAAIDLFELVSSTPKVGFLDERRFVLGELAHSAGAAKRVLGERDQADLWLSRAESAFRHTVNPTGCLTQVAYTRLALWYDTGRHREVLKLLPDIESSFETLGMTRDLVKARLFRAMVLKVLDRADEALVLLESLVRDCAVQSDVAIQGRILVDLGDTAQILGDHERALITFRKALPMLEASRQPLAVADLQMVVAATYRNLHQTARAAEAYAQAKASFARLGMQTKVAYVSLLRAEALLNANRAREAEWEILSALPTIEEQRMVPEGFAAVALLKESVRRRKTDPNALRELREHLQANR